MLKIQKDFTFLHFRGRKVPENTKTSEKLKNTKICISFIYFLHLRGRNSEKYKNNRKSKNQNEFLGKIRENDDDTPVVSQVRSKI